VKRNEVRLRILLVGPERGMPGGAAGDVIAAFQRLGGAARLEIARDAASALEGCRRGGVDLVLVDAEAAVDGADLAAALRAGGPPVVVIGDGDRLGRVRDLEQYTENIIQNMNSAMLVVDADGCITFCNPPAEQILGAAHDELRDQPVWTWFEDRPTERALLARTLAHGERFKGAESHLRRSDGARVPIGISCAPLSDSGGAKLGAVAIFQDLSEIKQLQGHVLQTEKMASIGQLAAGVAHEINNPMGFIHANLFQMAEYLTDLRRVWERVEALQRAARGGADARQEAEDLAKAAEEVDVGFLLSDFAKAIRESQEGSERIRHIVNDLRDFSHQDTGERVLADVNQCLDSTANIVWPMMKHLVVLERNYADLPDLPCYPMQLKQVFMNLLVNAYQAIEERVGPDGGTGTIRLRTECGDDDVTISVSDSGPGIAPEHLDRLFDPFFTTKKVGAGTGLGLSTCYSIVRRHGGRIGVDVRPGEGTTFRVVLPRDPGEETHGGD
jgi:PAS domain S-box-containing protein